MARYITLAVYYDKTKVGELKLDDRNGDIFIDVVHLAEATSQIVLNSSRN